MKTTHGAAADAEMARMERAYSSPAEAWEHAKALHAEGAISATDLKRVHEQLMKHGHQHQQHRQPQSLADLGRYNRGA